MRTTSRIALIGTLSMMLFSSAAFAAFNPAGAPGPAPGRPGGTPPSTTPGGHDACTGYCPSIADQATNYNDCSDKLLTLPHITGRQVEAIDESQRIHIAPVCDLSTSALATARMRDIALGNVTGLRSSIESNPLLMGELRQHGYRSIDVVGILLGSNAAVVYVHKA